MLDDPAQPVRHRTPLSQWLQSFKPQVGPQEHVELTQSARGDVLRDALLEELNPRDHLKRNSQQQPHSQSRFLSSMVQLLRASAWESPESTELRSLNSSAEIDTGLPKCFKLPSVDLDANTLDFLHSSGALRLPHPTAQRWLLEAYIQGVHSSMPCIDIHELVRCLDSYTVANSSISLMLYQAVMFAGSIFVSKDKLANIGYTTRASAMERLFRRAKVSLRNDKYNNDSQSAHRRPASVQP